MANEEHVKILKQGFKVWNKWRKENPGVKPDLREAILSGANLRNADLSGADLIEADLSDARLWGANLSDADFWEANLSGADLIEANLSKADLSEANLYGADLYGTNLSGANLYKAKLQGADFSQAIVDGETLVSDCQIDRDTNFELVGLGDMRIDSGTRQLLEYNIRKKNWDKWCNEQPPWKAWPVRFFWWLTDYGLSTGRIIRSFFILAIVFAMVYYVWGAVDYYLLRIGDDPGIVKNLFVVDGDKHDVAWCEVPVRSLYFSVVTMTTLGFGDMYSKATANLQSDPYGVFRCGVGHLLLMIQVLLGYVLLGALVTRFAVLFSAGGPAGKFEPTSKEELRELEDIRKKQRQDFEKQESERLKAAKEKKDTEDKQK